jgi:hypothetical protein
MAEICIWDPAMEMISPNHRERYLLFRSAAGMVNFKNNPFKAKGLRPNHTPNLRV